MKQHLLRIAVYNLVLGLLPVVLALVFYDYKLATIIFLVEWAASVNAWLLMRQARR